MNPINRIYHQKLENEAEKLIKDIEAVTGVGDELLTSMDTCKSGSQIIQMQNLPDMFTNIVLRWLKNWGVH